jgi:hypothetical protein
MVGNVKEATIPLEMNTNGGKVLVKKTGVVPRCGQVWFDPNMIANILGVFHMTKEYRACTVCTFRFLYQRCNVLKLYIVTLHRSNNKLTRRTTKIFDHDETRSPITAHTGAPWPRLQYKYGNNRSTTHVYYFKGSHRLYIRLARGSENCHVDRPPRTMANSTGNSTPHRGFPV